MKREPNIQFRLLSRLFYAFLFCISLAFLHSCEDYNELELSPPDSGSADLSNFVAVGDGFTAGFQNDALYESAQKYSYPNLIARQLRLADSSFIQPLIADPGYGNRIELTSLEPANYIRNSTMGSPLNQDEKPFNNLGVPFALLVDYTNPNNMGNLKERATDPDQSKYNPFYSLVMESDELQKSAPNLHNQVKSQNPSLITFWFGINDFMGYIMDGGEGRAVTDPENFVEFYTRAGQSLAGLDADVIVISIPDVRSFPILHYARSELQKQGVIHFENSSGTFQWITSNGNFDIYIETDDGPRVMQKFDYPIITSKSYFNEIEKGNIPLPIQQEHAIPDELIIDGLAGGTSELSSVVFAIQKYNRTISQVAASHGFILLDLRSILINQAYEEGDEEVEGIVIDGLVLKPEPGINGLFSYNGIHFSNKGNAMIANLIIENINSEFGANIPKVNIHTIPDAIPVATDE